MLSYGDAGEAKKVPLEPAFLLPLQARSGCSLRSKDGPYLAKADFHFCCKPLVAGSAKTSDAFTESAVLTLQITNSEFCVRWIEWLAVLESEVSAFENHLGRLGLVSGNGNANSSLIEQGQARQIVNVGTV
jgi:hypothetical protein